MWDVISDLYYGDIRPNMRTFRAGMRQSSAGSLTAWMMSLET